MPSASLTAARGWISRAVDLSSNYLTARIATVDALPPGDAKEAAKVPRDFMGGINSALVRAREKAQIIT